jgi:hypothetical protein
MTDIEREIQRIDTEDAWEETDEVVEIEVKRPLDKVIPIRLPSDKWEILRREARELGVGPTTLARMWLLERLRNTDYQTSARRRAPEGGLPPAQPAARKHSSTAGSSLAQRAKKASRASRMA